MPIETRDRSLSTELDASQLAKLELLGHMIDFNNGHSESRALTQGCLNNVSEIRFCIFEYQIAKRKADRRHDYSRQ